MPRQRWFTGDETPTRVDVSVIELRPGDPEEGVPRLAWLLVDVTTTDGADATYQVVLGGRSATDEANFMHGKGRVTVGELHGLVLYDALVDPALALAVLGAVAPDEKARVARPLLVEQSNTSVVYDERLILKLFRRVHDEPNPDVEVTRVLGERGFPHVVPQLPPLRRDRADLAVVRQYMLGATDAWDLAHTALRVVPTAPGPDRSVADFTAEATALGDVTARLHLAMADAFVVDAGDVDDRAAGVAALYHDVGSVSDPGAAIRVHGDLHLGQLLLADTGWYVIDFEGEPARPVEERLKPSSPLRDVAGMVRSFQYAARTALVERRRDVDEQVLALADAWEARVAEAFWDGYTRVEGIEALLPAGEADQRKLLRAFELDKAVYEVVYELGHRPDWVDVPASAIRRALAPVA